MGQGPCSQCFVMLLRGINVVGRHKVPMAQLRAELKSMGYSDVITLLNSGNVIFRADNTDAEALRSRVANHLREVFGFEIPTWVIEVGLFKSLFEVDPFNDEELHEHKQCYVTFLHSDVGGTPDLPYRHESGGFGILGRKGPALYSVLDNRKIKTPDVMAFLEKQYGKNITTRNWNTIQRILKELNT